MTAALLSVLSCTAPRLPEGLTTGDPLPAFRVEASDGMEYTPETLASGVSAVCFFNTSCPDCREELKVLQEVHEAHRDDLRMLLISRSEKEGPVASLWKEEGYTMPYSAQEDDKVFRLFARSTVPHLFLCLDGTVRFIHTDSPVADRETIESEISQLSGEGRP